jgi:hypothetical protein
MLSSLRAGAGVGAGVTAAGSVAGINGYYPLLVNPPAYPKHDIEL